MFSTETLWEGFGIIALWLGIPAIVLAAGVWLLRKRGSTTIAVKTTRVLSGAFLGLIVFSAIASTLSLISRREVYLSEPLRSWTTDYDVALQGPSCNPDGTAPFDPDSADARTLTFLCGESVENVPFGPRFVIYLGAILALVAAAAIAWAIQVAAYHAEIGDVFDRSVPRTFAVSAIIAMTAAVTGALLTAIGMTLAARSLDWPEGDLPPFFFDIPLWPFLVALGMFALAAIFRHGTRLQRETVGLV